MSEDGLVGNPRNKIRLTGSSAGPDMIDPRTDRIALRKCRRLDGGNSANLRSYIIVPLNP